MFFPTRFALSNRRIISFAASGSRTIPFALARRLLLSLAGLVLCAAVLFVPGRAQDLSGASGFTVAGTVLNSATGQPIARAEVILNHDQAQLTGGDGTFSFDHVPSGSATLSIRRPGYIGFGRPAGGFARGFESGLAEVGAPRRILVGPEMPPLTYRLIPLAAISGHLTLSTADPADDIQVRLFHREIENGRPRWTLVDTEKTRSDGSWRAAGLPAGRYMVQADASLNQPGDPDNSQVPVFGFPALYYPGVTDAGSAGVLILTPGQQAQADMTLVRQRFFPVTIAVQGIPDTPTSFEIADSSGRSAGLPVHYEFRTGIAHAIAPNGSWTLIARAFGETMRFGRTDFQVAGAPVTLAVSVAPVPPIPVIVNRDFTNAADSSQPSGRWGWSNLTLLPADDFAAGGSILSVHSEDGARMEIGISQPGKFWARTDSPGSTYVASVTSGGTDLATMPLTITPGSAPEPIEVTLRNDPGTIAGKVDMTAPGAGGGPGEVPQIWIYAIPLFPTTGHMPEAPLRDNGQFSLGDLVPGSYRVVACDTQQAIDFHSQDALAAWSGKGQVVTVDPNGTANVELTVIHGGVSE